MQDPKRCCFRAVTSASAAPLALRSEPLPAVTPARISQEPSPDAKPPPRIPELPVSHSQSFSPTKAVKALCRALATSCRFAGAPLHALNLPPTH